MLSFWIKYDRVAATAAMAKEFTGRTSLPVSKRQINVSRFF